MSQRELLRDHATKRHAHDQRILPIERVEQLSSVVSVVLHRVRAGGFVGLAKTTLIVAEQVEATRQRRLEDVRLHAQIAAAAADEQQALPATGALVIGLQTIELNERHDASYPLSATRS